MLFRHAKWRYIYMIPVLAAPLLLCELPLCAQSQNCSPEICDGEDNDCNGQADYPGETTDADRDGSLQCNDCNDNDPAIYPGNAEICDGKDNDCRNGADYPGEKQDSDGDGHLACNDCNDNDPAIHPGNVEVCDGKDNDCRGGADYPGEMIDLDGDGHLACNDCNDQDPGVYPGNTEICDGKDNNCNGQIDEGIKRTCGVSKGECRPGTQICQMGQWGSCQGSVGPSAEVCDGKDNNCNGQIDENLQRACGQSRGECRRGKQSCQAGRWLQCKGAIAPRAEKCDGKDNDCDGRIDEEQKLCKEQTNKKPNITKPAKR
ncbi:MAG: putative metal-binding motif-containing protein [Leptospiraceae bacterium]|nr:putative metal-binding motif-containing protein [Leptospiraceae bacterium]